MRRICGSEEPWTSWAAPFSWVCLFLFRRKLRLVDIFLPFFFFFFFLSRRTQAFSFGSRTVLAWSGHGKNKQARRFASWRPSSADQINKIRQCAWEKLLPCWRQRVFLGKQGERSHFIFAPDRFPRSCLPNFSFFFLSPPWKRSWPLWLRRLRRRPHGK